jgi:hypothetical protein
MHHKIWREKWMFCCTLIWHQILSLTPLGNTIRQLFNLIRHLVPPSWTFNNSTFSLHDALLSSVWWSVQTAIISVNSIKRLVLNAFTKLRKRLLASSRLSVRGNGTTLLPLDGFHEIWYWRIFRKFGQKIQVALKTNKNYRRFTRKPMYIYDNIPLNSS